VAAEYDEPLTDRELEITELVADGLTNREVAEELYISPNTVKVHLRNIFTKAGVSSRTELSMLAIQRGWIAVPVQENADAEEAVEEETEQPEPESDAIESEISFWPWTRWTALALGIIVLLGVVLLPEQTAVQSSPRGPGEVFEQANTTANVLVSDEEASWRELPPLPVRRAGAAAALWNERIVIMGGITDQGPTGQVDAYHVPDEVWAEWTPRPVALANVGAVALPQGILVPGGCDGELSPRSPSLYALTVSRRTTGWPISSVAGMATPIKPEPMPTIRKPTHGPSMRRPGKPVDSVRPPPWKTVSSMSEGLTAIRNCPRAKCTSLRTTAGRPARLCCSPGAGCL
jgi:DNA-binding CsgD family transcriptional regulator